MSAQNAVETGFAWAAGLRALKREWGWTGVDFAEIAMVSATGHVLVSDTAGSIHYLDPDTREIACLGSEEQASQFLADPEIQAIWRSTALFHAARTRLGDLGEGEVYSRTPEALLNDTYEAHSLVKLPLAQLLSFTGQVAYQTRDLPEGTPIQLRDTPPS